MTEQQPQPPVDPILKEIMNFSFTVDLVNAILAELGERPYKQVAALIAIIRQQGEPQFQKLLEKVKNESQAAPQESGN
jgi:hypothetical protein